MMTEKTLFILNTGSSSIKVQVFGLTPDLPLILSVKVVNIGSNPSFKIQFHTENRAGQTEQHTLPVNTDHEHALQALFATLQKILPFDSILAVGHRIVHGGEHFTHPTLLTDDVLSQLEKLNPLAPLHQPHNIRGVRLFKRIAGQNGYKNLQQYGCFDTAFHSTINPLHRLYALPESLRTQGVKRYGFHGLSYGWIAHVLEQQQPDLFKGKVVVAHLGNGASLCALKNGISVNTTMGMTALEGLCMGTRCGSLDAGVILYLQQALGWSVEQVQETLYNQSGLKGLSGLTENMQVLLETDTMQAKQAVDYFVWQASSHIANLAVTLGGLDAVVFTGGIGENADVIRDSITQQLSFLTAFETLVIPANEERYMALSISDYLL